MACISRTRIFWRCLPALGDESEAARQNKSLRLAGGNEARVSRLHDVPDGVRIDVVTSRSELPFNTQLNCSRFEVQEHRRLHT